MYLFGCMRKMINKLPFLVLVQRYFRYKESGSFWPPQYSAFGQVVHKLRPLLTLSVNIAHNKRGW